MFKIGGYNPSTGDLNVPDFASAKSKLMKFGTTPTDTHIIPEYTPLSDQGQLSSCVGNSSADSLEILKGLQDPTKVEQVSRLFIYYNARALERATNVDQGCFIHDALHSLTTLGVCRESTWAYDPAQVFTEPTIEAYREGSQNTITNFYQITSTGAARVADIESAIRANHPVIFGTQVGQLLVDYTADQGEIVFDPPPSSIGGHAILAVGVRINVDGKREFLIRNSWGPTFGLNGHCWFSEAYMTWNETSDLFVPTLMPDFVI
jgi:C1A family cysteine protease